MKTFNTDFIGELAAITKLSEKVNGRDKEKIFQMIKEHSIEIEELYKSNDGHWAVETSDLIVLCFELLIADKIDIDNVFSTCLPRFHIKLKNLLKTQS